MSKLNRLTIPEKNTRCWQKHHIEGGIEGLSEYTVVSGSGHGHCN